MFLAGGYFVTAIPDITISGRQLKANNPVEQTLGLGVKAFGRGGVAFDTALTAKIKTNAEKQKI